MRPILSTLVLAAALLPLSASANTLALRAKSQSIAIPTVGRTIHIVDVRPEGIDYYLSARIITSARSSSDTGAMRLGVVIALPSLPTEVEPIPSGLFTGFDVATSGEVVACDPASGGCGESLDFGGSPPTGAFMQEGGNVPVQSSLVARSASEAITFLESQPIELEASMRERIEELYLQGRVAWVGYLADPEQGSSLIGGFGGLSRAVSLRFSFAGAEAPFQLPLDVQSPPGAQPLGEVSTNVVVLGRGTGSLGGAELVPVDIRAIDSPNGDPDGTTRVDSRIGDPAFTPRGFDQVVRDTLGGRGGVTFVRETAQFLHLGRVSAAMPACVIGEDSPDCFDKGQCFDGDCVPPMPPEPFDAGFKGDGGSKSDAGTDADGGSPDAGSLKQATAHAALSRIFFEDRFTTRLTTLSRPSALRQITVGTEGSTEGVGPSYRNCPDREEDGGCSSAPGPSRFALVFAALALLMRKRLARG